MADSIIEKLMKSRKSASSSVAPVVEVQEEEVSMDGSEAVAQELIDAVEAKDAKAVVSAIKSLVYMLKDEEIDDVE